MIGKLDQRVTLQRFAETPDGIGGTTQAWADLTAVWAKVTPRMGRETLDEGRMAATGMATFTIRYRADLAETDRIVWRGEPWNIRRIMRVSQRNLYLDVDAERGVAP